MTERYLLGELSDAEAAEFELHFFDCAICAEDVRQGSLLVDNLRAVMENAAATEVIEVGRDRKLLELTVDAASGATGVECEFRHADLAAPIVIYAPIAGGRIQLVIPFHSLPAGSCVLIVRDKDSHSEINRYRISISN